MRILVCGLTPVTNDLLLSPRNVPVYENLPQDRLNHILHKSAIISAHRLNALGVHLIVFLSSSPVQASVSLLVDKEIREVHFLELQLNWIDELRRDIRSCILA